MGWGNTIPQPLWKRQFSFKFIIIHSSYFWSGLLWNTPDFFFLAVDRKNPKCSKSDIFNTFFKKSYRDHFNVNVPKRTFQKIWKNIWNFRFVVVSLYQQIKTTDIMNIITSFFYYFIFFIIFIMALEIFIQANMDLWKNGGKEDWEWIKKKSRTLALAMISKSIDALEHIRERLSK